MENQKSRSTSQHELRCRAVTKSFVTEWVVISEALRWSLHDLVAASADLPLGIQGEGQLGKGLVW